MSLPQRSRITEQPAQICLGQFGSIASVKIPGEGKKYFNVRINITGIAGCAGGATNLLFLPDYFMDGFNIESFCSKYPEFSVNMYNQHILAPLTYNSKTGQDEPSRRAATSEILCNRDEEIMSEFFAIFEKHCKAAAVIEGDTLKGFDFNDESLKAFAEELDEFGKLKLSFSFGFLRKQQKDDNGNPTENWNVEGLFLDNADNMDYWKKRAAKDPKNFKFIIDRNVAF